MTMARVKSSRRSWRSSKTVGMLSGLPQKLQIGRLIEAWLLRTHRPWQWL
jgi:hypothetical protein